MLKTLDKCLKRNETRDGSNVRKSAKAMGFSLTKSQQAKIRNRRATWKKYKRNVKAILQPHASEHIRFPFFVVTIAPGS